MKILKECTLITSLVTINLIMMKIVKYSKAIQRENKQIGRFLWKNNIKLYPKVKKAQIQVISKINKTSFSCYFV